MKIQGKKRAWFWVPTAYFAEGGPYMAVSTVSAILFKSLGMEDRYVALWTSLMMLPWSIKPLWAPFVDMFRTKRQWILATQLVMALLFTAMAGLIVEESLSLILIGVFFLLAFVSATHDVAVDGFYLIALDKHGQAFFAGIRGTFYRIASVSVQGGLVMLAGLVERWNGDLRLGWALSLVCAAGVMFVIFLWHGFALPRPAEDGPVENGGFLSDFLESFLSFFRMKGILWILLFLFFFRLAEAQLGKIAALFLQSGAEDGGLGLSLEAIGTLYGTVGPVALIAGGILGGVVVASCGFAKCIWPLVCAINLPDIVYVFLAVERPASLWAVGGCIAVEQFGYGLGYTAILLVMVALAENSGRYKTSHFAIMTGVTILGMMLVGGISGYAAELLGYAGFFWYVMACTIPSFLVTVPVVRLIPADFGGKSA
ncbi:MAG: MFS transporter [Lentisphaeria bacterium]|nr:MFS transporter [Lentisphaeria bacterium]